MFIRLLKLEKDQNILLLGPRGTGKSTLLRALYPKETSYWIDLLLPATEDRYARDPERLLREVNVSA
jgi:predicted AAA+ superfamily ATPase